MVLESARILVIILEELLKNLKQPFRLSSVFVFTKELASRRLDMNREVKHVF